MSDEIVLPLDLTGAAVTNKILNEEHELDNTTGKCFALNYGGFYSASLKIRDANTNQLLNPVTEYIVVAPYDSITKQTGKEAACAIVITRPSWQGEYVVEEYQAVGGEYATNVAALREVLENFNQDVGSVHWNSIIDKPLGFDAAPHLIDFRKEVVGFEGLIESINEIADVLGSPSAGQIAAMQSTLNSKLNDIQSQINNNLNTLSQEVDTLAASIPNSSGWITGSPAEASDVLSGNAADKYLRMSNIASLLTRLNQATNLSPLAVNTLDTTLIPLISGNFNLRANNKGDATVPNTITTYFVETFYSADAGFLHVTQIATATSLNYVLKRNRFNGTVTQWTRVDIGLLGTTAHTNLANATATTGGDINWEAPATDKVPTASVAKALLSSWVSTGRAHATGEVAQLDTTTVPTVWINANLRTSSGDTTVPNATALYKISTFVNAHLTTTAYQIAEGFITGTAVILMRQRVAGSPGTWTRVDAGRLAEITGWIVANSTNPTHLNWANPSLPTNAFMSPVFLREAIRYNMPNIYPVGMISVWPGLLETLPLNFVLCRGQLLSRTTYANLFAVINTRYGTTTSSNFRVPDLRGVVVRGLDDRNAASRDPDRDALATETAKLGHYQPDTIQNITGELRLPITGRTGSNANGVWGDGVPTEGNNSWNMGSGSGEWYARKIITFDASRSVRTSTNETRMKNISMHYVIKATEI